MYLWSAIIRGEPASKANSRVIVTNPKTKVPMVIKSKKALQYVKDFHMQLMARRLIPVSPIEGDVFLTAVIYYASRRPDLDDSLICDCLQSAGIIENDRQIKEKHLVWALDPKEPRVDLTITRIAPKKMP